MLASYSHRRPVWRACALVVALCLLALVSSGPLAGDHDAAAACSAAGGSLLLRVDAAIAKKTLTDAQLREIEDQWMEDEEEDEDDTPFKYRKTADGGRLPPAPGGPKTEMGFVTLNTGKDKKRTDELAGRWGDQMMTAGIDVRGYSIEDDRILFVCDQRGYKDMTRVREFVLAQPETTEFEWNSKKTRPGEAVGEAATAGAADPVAKFQQMQEEQAAAAKRAAKQKKKAAEKAQKEKAKRAAQAAKEKAAAEKKKQKAEAEKKQKATEGAASKPAAAGEPVNTAAAPKAHDEL